ncbi:MAG TPA: molybdopterin-dependent oxidoreductase [Aggregatilinea sp.]|uniref:molybdopterin-dependent oxidoreductase n=1 Tax=Aggregatilinea sp. TaxID=2806333 RepID=UPI002D11FB4B|nr:molybdopterin-dependent oxidoreductase [Aggregatilinea sp.]HML21958.1 molybdopterin-dependent oxidoreductase [Aggregatilinea sp.]
MTQALTALSRRGFIKLSAITAGALAIGDLPVAQAARDAGLINAHGDGVVPSMCEMCVWRCGLLAKVEGGRVVKLEGNPEHPHSRGRLCVRGQSGLMNTYDPDRVLTPLIRVGKRGEGKFRKASWKEALDLVASKMQEIKDTYGPEAMVFSSTHNLSQVQFENLLYAYGSPNYGTQRSLCFNAMIVANTMTYGMEEPERIYDADLQYVILTGRNLFEAISTSETGDLSRAIQRGMKVVYLDPRFTKTAAKATEWLPIKPGTDLAFHLALLNVIVTEDLYDHRFVERYTIGFDELAAEVAPFTPEWAAPLTELSADTIRRIAREFAAAAPHALAHNGWRTSNFINSFQTERAIAILNALVGNWNVTMRASAGESSGGLGKPEQPPYPRVSALRLDGVPYKFPVVPLKIGVFQELRDSILTGQPYEAHGWFISRQNPVMSLPDRSKTLAAFEKMDFIVTVDIMLNDTAWFSDVVLPEASYLERYDPLLPVGNRVYLRQPTIEPQGDAKSALWIYKQLGERLGLGDYFQYEDEEDYINQQLAPLGVTLDDMRETGYIDLPASEEAEPEYAWDTPSGKIEIFSDTLAKVGFPGVPTWDAPPEPGDGQFYLLTGKVAQATQFASQNNQLLFKYADEPRLWINDHVAADRGLKADDWVEVTSEVGQVHVRLLPTPGIRPDCVYMTPGYGHLSKGLTTAYGVGASDSVLHVTYTDPASGSQALTQTFVTIRKV